MKIKDKVNTIECPQCLERHPDARYNTFILDRQHPPYRVCLSCKYTDRPPAPKQLNLPGLDVLAVKLDAKRTQETDQCPECQGPKLKNKIVCSRRCAAHRANKVYAKVLRKRRQSLSNKPQSKGKTVTQSTATASLQTLQLQLLDLRLLDLQQFSPEQRQRILEFLFEDLFN